MRKVIVSIASIFLFSCASPQKTLPPPKSAELSEKPNKNQRCFLVCNETREYGFEWDKGITVQEEGKIQVLCKFRCKNR